MLRNSLAHVARGADGGAVLPVAGLAGRRGEVPLGAGAPRRHRHARCGARSSSSARTSAGSPRSPAAGSTRRRRHPVRLGGAGGPRARLATRASTSRYLDRAQALLPRAVARRGRRRRRAPGGRPDRLPAGRRARPSTWSATPTAARSRARRRRRHGAGHLLQRHRRRARPHPARRLPRRVPRAARRAHRGVLPAARGRAGARSTTASTRPTCGPSGCTSPAREAVASTSTARCPACPRVTRQRRRRRAPRGTSPRAWTTTGTDALVAGVLRRGRASARRRAPPGVEVVRRRGDDASWLFVINHTGERRRPSPRTGVELRHRQRRSPASSGARGRRRRRAGGGR